MIFICSLQIYVIRADPWDGNRRAADCFVTVNAKRCPVNRDHVVIQQPVGQFVLVVGYEDYGVIVGVHGNTEITDFAFCRMPSQPRSLPAPPAGLRFQGTPEADP